MPRGFSRAQAIQNRAFLKALRRTGNLRLACRELGLKYGTMQDRRRHHQAFALKCDAALAFAQARFQQKGKLGPRFRGDDGSGSKYRTLGGEMVICRRNDGRLQMRRAQPGKLTREAEQAFLAALSATCNMTLAAAAVGSCFNAFNRRRKKDPAFARELRLALKQGYDALEAALLEGSRPAAYEHDDWRHNEPPAMPPMSVNQALQLMYLHQKEARLIAEPWPIKRRPGETREAQNVRLGAMWEEQERLAREEFEVAEAERMERGEPPWGPAGEEVRAKLRLGSRLTSGRLRLGGDDDQGLGLPDLAQVTGWSKADPTKVPHHPGRALFGGWRIEDMEAAQSRKGGGA